MDCHHFHPALSPDALFGLKPILSDMSMSLLSFFGCVSFGWNLTFQAFTLSLCLSLELRWLSWGKHVAECCFLIRLVTSWLWIGEFNQFTFRVTIDKFLVLPFLSFVSWLLYSSFSLFPCIFVCHFNLAVFYNFFSVFSFMFHVFALD